MYILYGYTYVKDTIFKLKVLEALLMYVRRYYVYVDVCTYVCKYVYSFMHYDQLVVTA